VLVIIYNTHTCGLYYLCAYVDTNYFYNESSLDPLFQIFSEST